MSTRAGVLPSRSIGESMVRPGEVSTELEVTSASPPPMLGLLSLSPLPILIGSELVFVGPPMFDGASA